MLCLLYALHTYIIYIYGRYIYLLPALWLGFQFCLSHFCYRILWNFNVVKSVSSFLIVYASYSQFKRSLHHNVQKSVTFHIQYPYLESPALTFVIRVIQGVILLFPHGKPIFPPARVGGNWFQCHLGQILNFQSARLRLWLSICPFISASLCQCVPVFHVWRVIRLTCSFSSNLPWLLLAICSFI